MSSFLYGASAKEQDLWLNLPFSRLTEQFSKHNPRIDVMGITQEMVHWSRKLTLIRVPWVQLKPSDNSKTLWTISNYWHMLKWVTGTTWSSSDPLQPPVSLALRYLSVYVGLIKTLIYSCFGGFLCIKVREKSWEISLTCLKIWGEREFKRKNQLIRCFSCM